MHTSSVSVLREVSIPVPWGIVAAKTWGDEKGYPCIVLHGTMDNCGSFDSLMPLLPGGFYFICMDLPGHGKSSHFPAGVPLSMIDFLLTVKLVVKHFKFEELYLMGHSLGAQISSFFTAIYPELIKRLILIDGIIPETTSENKAVKHYRKILDEMVDHLVKVEGKTPPSYSYEEAFHRTLTNRWHSQLTEDAARIMLKRSLVPSNDGYSFSTDQRLKITWRPLLSTNQLVAFVSSIKCPVLLILAKETYDRFAPIYGEDFLQRLDFLLYNSANIITCVTVEGTHDVHLNYADRVAPHVSNFLVKQVSKL